MRIHHLGYAVKNMDASIKKFLRIGYEKVGETVPDEARRVLIQFMSMGNYIVELVAPMDATSSINGIISKSGNTPYHICYIVDNIDEEIQRLKNEGYVLVDKPSCAPAIDCSRVAFLYSSHMGIIELVEERLKC